MRVIRGVRERTRVEITAAIKDEARRQLAEQGAAKLSLRAVARELGMVSSALYRYFPNRDELLTALILDAYDAIGEAAENALDGVSAEDGVSAKGGDPAEIGGPAADSDVDDAAGSPVGADPTGSAGADDPVRRWTAVCLAVRRWALDHPHQYALIHGSPVPGYAAPRSTAEPAARVGLALIAVARDAYAAGALRVPERHSLPEPVGKDARSLAERIGVDLPEAAVAGLIAAWAQLFGLISFELFGHYGDAVEAREEFFAHSAAALARAAGLTRGPSDGA